MELSVSARLDCLWHFYAENIVGIGRCSKLSEGCVARDPCDPPGTPEATHVTKDTIVIEWTKPEYDGGSNITGYIVERRDLPEGRWIRANFTQLNKLAKHKALVFWKRTNCEA